MKQVSKASQLNKSVKQVSLASQVKQVGLASQVSNLPKSSQESEIKKVLVKQVQVKQVKSSKFKLSNLNQASEVMLDRDTAPRKRPSTRLSGIILSILYLSFSLCSKPSQLIHAEQNAPQNDPSCAVGKGLRSTWDAHRTQQGLLPDQTHVCHLTTFLPVTRTQKKSGQKMSPYVARTSGLKFGHGINPQIIPTEYN